MTISRAFLFALLGTFSLALGGCYVPSNPPPPRVHVTYQPPVYEPPKVAVQFVTSERGLTSEQIESRREEALRYLQNNGYLRENESLVDDASVADRVLYVSPSQQIGGSYDVRVFTPDERNERAYGSSYGSSLLDDDWDRPRVSSSITIINPRPYYGYGWGYRDPFLHGPIDPFFPSSSFYYRRDYLRPYHRGYYAPPLGWHYPHLPPPPPRPPRYHHGPRSGHHVQPPPAAPRPSANDPAQQEQIPRPRPKHQP